MSQNTVRKYVCELEEQQLISTENTTVVTKDSLKRNGTLRYTVQPFQNVPDAHLQNQLHELELATTRWEHSKTVSL